MAARKPTKGSKSAKNGKTATNGRGSPRSSATTRPAPDEPCPAPAATIGEVIPGPPPGGCDHTDPPGFQPVNSRSGEGRMLSEYTRREKSWMIPDIIPRETLTMVVGDPHTGKSTMLAWIASKAQRPAFLPGYEEAIELLLYDRAIANNVNLSTCLMLADRDWRLPGDRNLLCDRLSRGKCDVLLIDPIDSYITFRSENDEEAIRLGLESLIWIAEKLRIAIVGVRHPGKTPGNWCPGSRMWRAKPRLIWALTLDEGPPLRTFIRAWKPGFGVSRQPREYALAGEEKEPRRFSLGPVVSAEEADVIASFDPLERTMIEDATELLHRVLAEGRQPSTIVRAMAEREGIKDGILRRAGRRLGYIKEREGSGAEHVCYWSLPHSVTPSLTHRHPPLTQ